MEAKLFKSVSRDHLAAFLRDHQTIKAFERLFVQAGLDLPADIATLYRLAEEASIDANTAAAGATSAHDHLARIAHALEVLATAPASQPTDPVLAAQIRSTQVLTWLST